MGLRPAVRFICELCHRPTELDNDTPNLGDVDHVVVHGPLFGCFRMDVWGGRFGHLTAETRRVGLVAHELKHGLERSFLAGSQGGVERLLGTLILLGVPAFRPPVLRPAAIYFCPSHMRTGGHLFEAPARCKQRPCAGSGGLRPSREPCALLVYLYG
jgi:hypothetical protein